MIPFLTARAIEMTPPLLGHHLRMLSIGFVSKGLSDRVLTTKAKRSICSDSASNGPCDWDYAITNRPLRPLPRRLPIRLVNCWGRVGGKQQLHESLTSLARFPVLCSSCRALPVRYTSRILAAPTTRLHVAFIAACSHLSCIDLSSPIIWNSHLFSTITAKHPFPLY